MPRAYAPRLSTVQRAGAAVRAIAPGSAGNWHLYQKQGQPCIRIGLGRVSWAIPLAEAEKMAKEGRTL